MLFFLSLGKGYKSSTTKEIEGVWGQGFKNLVTIQIDFINFIELFPLLGHIVKTVNDVNLSVSLDYVTVGSKKVVWFGS